MARSKGRAGMPRAVIPPTLSLASFFHGNRRENEVNGRQRCVSFIVVVEKNRDM